MFILDDNHLCIYTDGADSSSCSYWEISILLRQSADSMNILFMWKLYVAHEIPVTVIIAIPANILYIKLVSIA